MGGTEGRSGYGGAHLAGPLDPRNKIRGRGKRAPGQGPQPPLPRSPPASPPAFAGLPACQGKRARAGQGGAGSKRAWEEGEQGALRGRVSGTRTRPLGWQQCKQPLPPDAHSPVPCAGTSQSSTLSRPPHCSLPRCGLLRPFYGAGRLRQLRPRFRDLGRAPRPAGGVAPSDPFGLPVSLRPAV